MTHATTTSFPRTIGMDLGTRRSSYCVVDPGGDRVREGSLKTERHEVREFLESEPRSRLVIEASGPSHWIAELAESLGHEVIVSNPRDFRLIAESHRKTDRNDARILASFGQFRPELLRPIQLRGVKCQVARSTLAARSHLVAQRTELVNFVRAQVRNLGDRLPTCAAYAFHRRAADLIPAPLQDLIAPLLGLLERLHDAIKSYDKQIEHLCEHSFPETAALRQVSGVGPNTSLSFVATIEDPKRFPRSRDVGAYVGLVSKSRSSGQREPDLRISKRGDASLRRLLVNSAAYIVGPRGGDCDLRRFGERLQGRGGQAARGKARIAVARKLAVLLHRLWITSEVYDPHRHSACAA